ncbi:MAG: polyprenyl synthetase family protein [Bdellovibrionales bacterium]
MLVDFKIYSEGDFPSYLPKLNQLFDDLFEGGKGFRSKLVGMISEAIGLNQKSTHLLCQTIEFIHNASLLHDDLIDRAPLRRGKTASWLKYGPERSILAGDYLLARVMVNLSSHGNIELVQLTAKAISDLLEGEWLQDDIIGSKEVLFEDLDRIHILKTASLFEWCFLAPFVASEKLTVSEREDLLFLGRSLGQLFQRADDLLDFDIRNIEDKKVLGDLQGGYLNSFGILLFADISPEDKVLAFQSNNMQDLFSIVSKSDFESKLEIFDQKNRELIKKYEEKVERLSTRFTELDSDRLEEFKSLANILYFRGQ